MGYRDANIRKIFTEKLGRELRVSGLHEAAELDMMLECIELYAVGFVESRNLCDEEDPRDVIPRLRARVKELEATLTSMKAGAAPTFSIYRITDSGFSDAKYLVRADGRHLPVFNIRDDVWGMWMHQGPRQCEYPDASIEIMVIDARGCSMPKGALGIVATDQPREAE